MVFRSQNKGVNVILFAGLCCALLLTITSCEKFLDKRKCRGCPEEQPWSVLDHEYCYPTQEVCEQETGEECETCDRKPKDEKDNKNP